jgi:hypothetical protein
VVLVPFPDGRALICFDGSITPSRLELMIQDALEEHDLPAEDGRVFEGIRDVLRTARRSDTVDVRQPHIILFEVGGGNRIGGSVRGDRRRTAR